MSSINTVESTDSISVTLSELSIDYEEPDYTDKTCYYMTGLFLFYITIFTPTICGLISLFFITTTSTCIFYIIFCQIANCYFLID